MPNVRDFNALWMKAATDWSRIEGRKGADHVDAFHTKTLFRNHHDQYGLRTTQGPPRYTPKELPGRDAVTIVSQEYRNNTKASTSGRFRHDHEETSTFTVAVTEGLEITESTPVHLGLAGLCCVPASPSLAAGLASTQERTATETRAYKVDHSFDQPPRSTTRALVRAERLRVSGTARVPIQIEGRVAVALHKPWEGHHLWFIGVGRLLRDTRNVPPWLEVVSDGLVVFQAELSLSGTAATRVYVTLDQDGKKKKGEVDEKIEVASTLDQTAGVGPAAAGKKAAGKP